MLIGDRYVRGASDRWLDIATGWSVEVAPRAHVDCGNDLTRFLFEAWSAESLPEMVDVIAHPDGALVVTRSSEEHGGAIARAVRRAAVDAARDLTERVSRGTWVGPRQLRVACLAGHQSSAARECLASLVAIGLRSLGFVSLRAGVHLPAELRQILPHRHVSVLILDEGDAASARVQLEELVRRSPRGHLVCDLRRSVSASSRVFARERAPAATGDRYVSLIHAIPEILELIHAAEDDLSALRAAARWGRRHSGALGVAAYGTGGSGVVIDDGRATAGFECVLPQALRSVRTEVHALGDEVLVVEPVKYGGARIGYLLVRATKGAEPTARDVAATLSALTGPAIRVCLDTVTTRLDAGSLAPEILGGSPAMTAVRQTVARVASAPFAVLIEGESGTGKELVARAIHRLSPRRDRRFSAVNCAALTDELIEAELFGHARGAFTGAVGPRAGLFEDAHLGTVFLDESAELSPRAQAKLLRVLQEREVRRVGENVPRPVDVRVLAATNRPLADAAVEGRFREDLLFRLAVVRIRLPPLRERIEDVPELALATWRHVSSAVGKRASLGADALTALCRHDWPGNVRELQNAMAAVAVLAPAKGRVSARHVLAVIHRTAPGHDTATGRVLSLEAARALCERQTIAAALARHGGRRSAAARELGVSRQGLAKAIRRLGLERGTTQGVA